MPSETVQLLRQQLKEKFPTAHRGHGDAGLEESSAPPAAPGDPPFWDFEPGTSNFPSGAITEISPAHPACGLTLLFAALLADDDPDPANPKSEIQNPKSPLALIDARDRFDPASFTTDACRRLLWLRCRETREALQSADLLLRDGNLPVVLLDLSALPARELRRIPTATWHRLRQLAEASACTLLALTPTPLIPRASLRLRLTREFTLQDLDCSRCELLPQLQAETTRRRIRTA